MHLNLGKKFERLPSIIAHYEEEYAECSAQMDLSGRTLQQILTTNSQWMSYYAERASELKHIVEHMDTRVEEVKGKLFKGYKKGSNIALGVQEINQFIKADPEFVEVNIKMLEVKEIHDKFVAAVDTFRMIGYAMNNLTKIRVAGLEDDML